MSQTTASVKGNLALASPGKEGKEKKEKENTALEKRAKPVQGFYEARDLSILRDALLKNHGLTLNALFFVEGLKSGAVSTYLVNPFREQEETAGGENAKERLDCLNELKEALCAALLSKEKNKQILFPYRMCNVQHWVLGQIFITDNIITLQIHDSTQLYKKEPFEARLKYFFENSPGFQSFLDECGSALNPLRNQTCLKNKKELKEIFFNESGKGNLTFKNVGRSAIFPIQIGDKVLKNVYCGGYALHLMFSLLVTPKPDFSQEAVWGCGKNKPDQNLRNEDAALVTQHNPSQVGQFGTQSRGDEYRGSKDHLTKDSLQKEKMAFFLEKMGEALKNIDSKLLNELYQSRMSCQLDLSDAVNIKKFLVNFYNNNRDKLSSHNPFSYFFKDFPQAISADSQLHDGISTPDLWAKFCEALRIKVITPANLGDKGDRGTKFSSKSWDLGMLEYFLKLMIISSEKADVIDFLDKDLSVVELKKLLLEVRDRLIKNQKTKKSKGIIIFRKFMNEWVAFQLYIEMPPETKKSAGVPSAPTQGKKTEEVDEKTNQEKRMCLNIWSHCFSEDYQIELRGRKSKSNTHKQDVWRKQTESIKFSKTRDIKGGLKELINEDFLKPLRSNSKEADFKMTRLNSYTVPGYTEFEEYKETLLVHKILHVLELEIRPLLSVGKIGINIKEIEAFHHEYREKAKNSFLKDAAVAKAQQGFAYQEYLIMLIAYLAMESIRKTSEAMSDESARKFSLMAEALVPEAWNDIFLEWGDELIFFQQKHRSSSSVSGEACYSSTEILANAEVLAKKSGKKNDAAILKYYQAYLELIKNIKDSQHPFHKHQHKLKENKLKFIFFSNKDLPVEQGKDFFFLKRNKKIIFKKVPTEEVPLIALEGFKDLLGKRTVWQVEALPAAALGLPDSEQENLDEFLKQFYYFTGQMNAPDLLQHCKKVIQPSLVGYGQAVLANTFAQYVHQWFVSENPRNHAFDYTVIADFFQNHERYHGNLVKYSCYDHPTKAIDQLLKIYLKSIMDLSCFKKLLDSLKTENFITLYCQDPLLALSLVQNLFKAGHRQVFTPFSAGTFEDYKLAAETTHIIVVTEEDNHPLLHNIKNEMHDEVLKIIQIKKASSGKEITLKVMLSELNFLFKEYGNLSIFGKFKENDALCLTDLLFFAVSVLSGSLSEEEKKRYVPQRLSEECVVLPYDELETKLKEEIKSNELINGSWVLNKNDKTKLVHKIKIQLPKDLRGKKIQLAKNKKFEWDEAESAIFYIINEISLMACPTFPNSINAAEIDDFNQLGLEIKEWIDEKKSFSKFPEDYPAVRKYIAIPVSGVFQIKIPSENWLLSTTGKTLFFYPFGRAKLYSKNLENIYSTKTISIIEAEAACGKTWYLRSLLSVQNMLNTGRIPVFIRIKDLEKIKDLSDPIPELIEQTTMPQFLKRLILEYPERFHLLLDGYDELLQDFEKHFKSVLEKITYKSYSVTVTVRDYKNNKLQELASSIRIQQKLNKFNDAEIELCLQKLLCDKIPSIDQKTLSAEIIELRTWLQNQEAVSDWLGIPFHVALIAEWYSANRNNFSKESGPSVSDIYNFIIKNRIQLNSKRNSDDIYKRLNALAIQQLFNQNLPFKILSDKKSNFKKDICFDLERTGLLRNPYAESPELFHRTFAEFLVAKKLVGKAVKQSCANDSFNLELVKILYQTENRVICRFFIDLFKNYATDPDIPYELTDSQYLTFQKKWLCDFLGQNLISTEEKKSAKERKVISWKTDSDSDSDSEDEDSSEEDDVKIRGEHSAKNKLKVAIPSSEELSKARDFIKNIPNEHLNIMRLAAIQKLIIDNEITLLYIQTILSAKNDDKKFSIVKNYNIFKIIGLYLRSKPNDNDKKALFKILIESNMDVFDSFYYFKESAILKWWSLEDIICLIASLKKEDVKYLDKFITMKSILFGFFAKSEVVDDEWQANCNKECLEVLKSLKPSSENYSKSEACEYFLCCLTLHRKSTDLKIKLELSEWIRTSSLEFFLRDDYPEQGDSLLVKYGAMDELDISLLVKAFNEIKEISSQYNWRRNKNSHAFTCWSQGGYKDSDFAFPVLKHIAGNLHVIHVFYIVLYVEIKSAGYDSRDKETILNVGMKHIKQFKKIKEASVPVIFASVLLFLSLIKKKASSKEKYSLSIKTAEKMLQSFEILLNDPTIPFKTKLFIQILLVDFITYFGLRMYGNDLMVSMDTMSTFTITFNRGITKTLKIVCSNKQQIVYQMIFNCMVTVFKSQSTDSMRLEHFIQVWEKLLSDPTLVLEESHSSGASDSEPSVSRGKRKLEIQSDPTDDVPSSGDKEKSDPSVRDAKRLKGSTPSPLLFSNPLQVHSSQSSASRGSDTSPAATASISSPTSSPVPMNIG